MICPRCFRDYAGPHRFCPFDGERLSDRPARELARGRPSCRASGLFCERYAVRGLLGTGAMTRVYLGEDLFTRDAVAIKVLEPKFAQQRDVRDRFLREASATSRLAHPNIVRTFEAGEGSDGLPFLVLELLPGEPLAELLKRERVLHPRTAFLVLTQIASALAAAHQAGIVHRDVKPANIQLLGAAGPPTAAKLLDFGLAKLDEHTGFTQAGTAVGTVEYMAPEQVVSDPVDGRTDVYGLGVVMYRMFTGQLVYDARGVDLMAAQLLTPAPPPSTLGHQLAPEVEAVLMASLRKQPSNRYPSMEAFLEDLERLSGKRSGELLARSLPPGPDVYTPGEGFGRTAAEFLYNRLGQKTPPWDD
jgi:eukaryotic-like serine/threonine-protein kinase